MITIGKPFVAVEGERAYLKARVDISDDAVSRYVRETNKKDRVYWVTDIDYPPVAWKDEDFCAFFSVQKEYAKYLCVERSNAFVIAFFWYACVAGSDITFEMPMSKRLYDGITSMLLPRLRDNGVEPIKLIGPVTDEKVKCENGVVTGMSGGVDSSYTLMNYGGDNAPGGKKLTHLAIYEAAYYLFTKKDYPDDVDAIYESEDKINAHVLERAKMIAEHNNLPLIHVRTNLDKGFYRGALQFTAMYRYLACTLSLEHLYNTYISSSSGHEEGQLEVSLFAPTQHYEDFLCECLQTENFVYMTSDHDSRITKLKALADNTDFQKSASVCFNTQKDGENCGECYGCWKTMIPLDFIGKLDNFRESFDVDKYYANRENVYKDLIEFSKSPECSSARKTIELLLEEADKEPSEAGELFRKVYAEKLSPTRQKE